MELQVDGRRVACCDFGKAFDPAQASMVFVHGAGLDHTVWSLQARYAAWHGWNALAPDLPGHGRGGDGGAASAGPALAGIDAMAAWLAALLAGLAIERAVLVGHSMGALVALAAAARGPERVAGLALFGAAPAIPVHPALLAAAADEEARAQALIAAWGHGGAGHVGGTPAAGSWIMGQALRTLARAPAGVLQGDLAACQAYGDGTAAAARIACPALIVAGDQDRMTPLAEARRLAALLPRARLVTLPQAGHMLLSERPTACLDALIDWLAAEVRA